MWLRDLNFYDFGNETEPGILFSPLPLAAHPLPEGRTAPSDRAQVVLCD